MDIARQEKYCLMVRLFCGGGAAVSSAGDDIVFVPNFGKDFNLYVLLMALDSADDAEEEDGLARRGRWAAFLDKDRGSVRLACGACQSGETDDGGVRAGRMPYRLAQDPPSPHPQYIVFDDGDSGVTQSLWAEGLREAMTDFHPSATSLRCVYLNGEWRLYPLLPPGSPPADPRRAASAGLYIQPFLLAMALLCSCWWWWWSSDVHQEISGFPKKAWHLATGGRGG